MMSFHHGERVFVKSGFHTGRHGTIFARVFLFWYGVDFGDSEHVWFYPWQLGKVFRFSPVDNTSTMENVKRARDVIDHYEKM